MDARESGSVARGYAPKRLARARYVWCAGSDRRQAQELKDEIEEKAAKLPDHPKLYKPSPRVRGMREMVVRSNYIVLYRETKTLLEVVNVFHARRQWP